MILHRHHPSSLRSLRRQHWIKWLQITTVFLWSLFPPFYTPAPAAYTPDSQSPPQPVWDGNGDEPESGPDLSDDDSDGLPNWFEQWLGSDVGNPDSDYDGLSDADEQYLTGTDPINWDSNSDGYSDHDAFYNCWAVNHNAVGFGQSVYDWDGDGIYNPQDAWPFDATNGAYDPNTHDSDGDGIADAFDSYPYDVGNPTGGDSSGDPDPGEGDPEPTDDDVDDDGHPDGQDSDPNDSTLWDDANRNGINDSAEVDPFTHDSDNDGFVDALDSNPWDPVLWTDWNSNNQNDHDETSGTGTYDYDDDGVNDSNDSHPLDSTLWADWNNNSQHDPEELDSDGDTVSDLEDTDPHNSALWNDHNRNGINDDDNDPLSIDTDLDGVPDVRDSHPYSDQLWIDFNDNGFNDDYPTDDLDGDSHSNETDSHPSNSDLWEDWDDDGINDSDSGGGGGSDDSDSDNYPNHLDSHPQESTLWSDWDFDSLNLDDELAHQTDPQRPDTDQDGLTDGEEVSYSTNPTLWDTDNDGLSDFEELRGTFGSNPRDAYSLSKNRGWGSLYDDWQMASLVDTDLDGIPNRIEELYGLNPNNPQDAASDLDGDGITNRIAYQQGRALIAIVTPLDRDGDGLTDAQEDFWGRRNPGLLSKFNPQDAVKDPDNDDLMNWQEVQFNSNPGIAVSTPHGKIGNVNDGTVYFWQSLIQSNSSYHFLALTRLPQGYQDSINDWMDTDYNPDANGSPTITPPGLQAFLSTVSPIDRLPGRKAPGDYDGDGMPDQWEWRYRQKLSTLDSADAGTPNQTPTLKQDPDSDALSNLAEFQLNTHPLLPDTDGDGFADGLEVQHGSSPTQVTSLPPLSLTVISGNSQTTLVDTLATQPLIVATRRITTPVPSTPVTFTVPPTSAGQISTSPTGPWTSTVSTTSSSTGNAQVYWKAPASPGNSVVTAVSPSHPTISPVNFGLAATNPSPNPTPGPGPGSGPGGGTTPPPGTMVWHYSERSVSVQNYIEETSAVRDSDGNWQPPEWVTRLGVSFNMEDGDLGGRILFHQHLCYYEVRAGSPLTPTAFGHDSAGETTYQDLLLTASNTYLNQNMVFGPHSTTGDVFADDKQDISRFVNERQMRWVVQGGVLSESQSRSFLVRCATKSYAQGAPPEEIKYFPVSFRANAGLEAGTLASVEISNPGPAATHGIRVAGQTLVLQPPIVANQRTILSLLPIDITGHRRGTFNATGAVSAGGTYGKETVLLENADRDEGSATQRDLDTATLDKVNDDDLVKVVLSFPANVKPSGVGLKLKHEGMKVDGTKPNFDSAVVRGGASRLNFYDDQGNKLTDADLNINDLANPGSGYMAKIVTAGTLTLFIEGADDFGRVGTDDTSKTNAAFMGGALLTLEVTGAGSAANSGPRLLVFRGGFMRYRQPESRPGELGILEFRDGKGRVTNDITDLGTVVKSWDGRSGKLNGLKYDIPGKNGHIPPGWRLIYKRSDLTPSQRNDEDGTGNALIVKQGGYCRWLQDDKAPGYTTTYLYQHKFAADRNIGKPSMPTTTSPDGQTIMFKFQTEGITPADDANREDIQFHPDGKKDGTAGCIGIQSYDDCKDVYRYLNDYRALKLKTDLE